MSNKYDAGTAYDYLLETGIATEDELALVSSIMGHSLDTYESVLFSRTGFRTFDQLEEEDD
jgi:hypothetical protein